MKAGLLGTRVVHVDGEWEGLIPDEFVTLVTPALRKPVDAEFIAAAPATVARLTAALEAVLEVHQPIDAAMFSGRHERIVKVCTGCGTDDGNWQRYPCPTVAAIEGVLKEGQ
jgi:hypothetical protein